MKKLLSLIILITIVGSAWGQCDLTIIGWNSDNPDQILIQAIANIPPNKTYYITDNEWNGTSFNSGEQIATFSTNSSTTILSGSTIFLDGGAPLCGTFGGTIPALAVGGDEIYITNINPVGSVAASNICFAASLGLAGGGGGTMPSNSISTSLDNGVYNGTGDITNPSNWTFSDNIISLPTPSCTVSLPVKLSAFSVSHNGKEILLNWQTASEINNSHFDVEHSKDGINFGVIGSVEGHGTSHSKQSYTYTDSQTTPGTHFYRLVQVDYDGRAETFEVKSINLGLKNKLRVFPTETSDHINIENTADDIIALYDINGKLLMDAKNQNRIDVSYLPSGMYFIKTPQEVVKFRKI